MQIIKRYVLDCWRILMTEEQNTDKIRTREKLLKTAREFNLLSNVFMSVALDDIPACQHVIRVLTGIKDLIVKEIRPQYRISKITSHDAILDILAEDSKGKLYNLEIQRAETLDHARRTRFYGAMIDSEYLKKGKMYDEMPDVHIIYISETDIWKAGHTSYQVEKYFKDTDIAYDDGIHVLYVNTAINDDSEAAAMMQYFKTANPEDMSQGNLSKRVHFLKCEEGGQDIMCEVSEKIYKEGELQGELKGELGKAKKTSLKLAEMGFSVEKIAEIVEMSVEVVKQWLGKDTVA